jgi:hypothetical protein
MTVRDPRTGRFVATVNVPESREGTFPAMTDLPVGIQGADPADLAYGTEQRPAQADELAQGGQWPLLRARHPALVAADEHARTVQYGQQGALLRDAARLHGLTGMLAHVVGLEPPAGRANGAEEITDDH